MTYIQAFILGIVQGITEFLPISSSGHLVIVPYLMGWKFPTEQIFPFNVLIQVGTLLAVIIYFWKDLFTIISDFISGVLSSTPFGPKTRLGWLLILATIPAVIGGLLFKNLVETAFQSIVATAIFLLLTAVILFLADRFGKNQKSLSDLRWNHAIIIGLFQMAAIFPGVSRSGSTIAGGVLQNLNRKDSARFSFLLSIPVMLGAAALSLKDLFAVSDLSSFLPVLLVGFITSAIVGYAAIHWLLRFLQNHRLRIFAIYCTAVGVALFVTTLIR